MNAHARRRTLAPLVTVVCAGIVGLLGLQAASAQAEGVPTPSETSVAEATEVSASTVDVTVAVPPTAPTGTTMPVAP
jgi:hypothetical protein